MEGILTFQKEYRDQHISHGFLDAFLHYLIICEKVTVKRSFYRPHLRSEKLDFISSQAQKGVELSLRPSAFFFAKTILFLIAEGVT